MNEEKKTFPSVSDVYLDNALTRNRRLKAYFIHRIDETYEGDVILSYTAKEALKIARKELDWTSDGDWIDLRANKIKDCNTDGLTEGVLDVTTDEKCLDSIKRGFGTMPETELPCPKCGKRGILSVMDDQSIMCENCEENQ